MSKPPQLQNCPQCTARSKRTKERCKGPAVKGWKVCRFHGAGGGAPRGKAHGNYRHGEYSLAAKLLRQEIAVLVRKAKLANRAIDSVPLRTQND